MGQRGMVTGREFAALQDQVLALTEVVARMAQAQAATMVTQEQSVAQAQAATMVTQEQSLAQAATMVTDPPHTPQFEESPLEMMETDIIAPTASEDFGNLGLDEIPLEGCSSSLDGREEDFPDQDLSALAGRAAEKLGLEVPELSESPHSPLNSKLYGGRSRHQRPLPRFPAVAEEVHSTWGSPLSAPDPVQDFSSVMNVDGADKDGYLQFPPPVVDVTCAASGVGKSLVHVSKDYQMSVSLFQKAYLSAGEGCCALSSLGLLQAYQAALLHDLPTSPSPTVVMEIRRAADMALRLTRCAAQAMGRAMGACVVGHRHLWLAEAGVLEGDRMPLLDAPYTPGKAFEGAVPPTPLCRTEPNPTESLGSGRNGRDQFTQTTEMAPVKLEDCSQTLELIVKVKEEDEEEEGYGEFLHTEITSEVVNKDVDEEGGKESVDQRERPKPCSDDGNSPSASGEHGQQHEIQTGETSLGFSQCGKSISQPGNHETHQRINTGKKPHHCSQCGKSYTRIGKLEAHQRTHTGDRPYHCPQCGKRFNYLANLRTHQIIHTGEKPFQCSQCWKSFRVPGHLREHERIHTGEKPFCCTLCGKSFTRSGHLKSHQRIHTGERPYHCSQCDKCFTDLTILKTHARIHTEVRPYDCSECGESFRHLDNLTKHQRTHTGERPHLCSQCGKGFFASGDLKKHQRIHTGEKPYHCSQCGKSFTYLHNFKTHQRIHTGEKPYDCSVCGKSFTQMGTLKRHERTHTGKP